MSTVVYQELHPCYESNNFLESRRLSLKLTPPPKDNSVSRVGFSKTLTSSFENLSSKPDNDKCLYSNMFGWSGSIESVTNITEQPVYVHPLVKRSSAMLSQKSLEMCTESLGCETGTCMTDNSVFFPSTMTKPRPKTETRKERAHVKQLLPPPLTTISGPNSIHVKPFREHGRLVIKAVSAPTTHSYLQAKRSNGRLTLSLTRDDIEIEDEDDVDEQDNHIMYDRETSYNNERECSTRNDHNNNNDENEDEDDEKPRGRSTVSVVKEEGEEKRREEGVISLGENKKEIEVIFGGGNKVGHHVKIQRQGRCMERGQGNKRLVNWEPFWVAT